jgi:hypothetical protein
MGTTWTSPATSCHREDHTVTIEISFMTPLLNRITSSFYDEP